MELKKPTTYTEQMEILRSRGIIIEDEEFCKKVLADVNYYRLTAYFLPFKLTNGRESETPQYVPDTSFRRVYRIYEFDRKLRSILLTAIGRIEIFLRAHIAYYHAHKYGAEGYLDPHNFNSRYQKEKFVENFNREVSNRRKALFVKHHIDKYDSHFPIWVATELFTFGMLSRFYSDMCTSDQKDLSRALYDTTNLILCSWLRCCTNLRNACAHDDRLYFQIFTDVPAGIDMIKSQKHRLWGAILTLKALYPDKEEWNTEVLPEIRSLISEYANDIELHHMAFPEDWEQQLRN